MKTLSYDDDTPAAEIIRAAEHEDVVLMRNGRAVALVVGFDDEDLEWYARERDPDFLASIARARAQVEKGKTKTHQELKRELGLDRKARAKAKR